MPAANIDRIAKMKALLVDALAPVSLEVHDDSHKHVGHAGARDGRGHFRVDIVSAAFAKMAPLARHRAVYSALGDMMVHDIHALSITARTPDERGAADRRGGS
jgi:BolA family transcriptional regulator, general stress-responsive regulator